MIGFHQAGYSQRRIGRILNRSCQTVKLCIHRYKNKGVQGLVMRYRSGLQRLTTIEEDMAIILASKKTLFF